MYSSVAIAPSGLVKALRRQEAVEPGEKVDEYLGDGPDSDDEDLEIEGDDMVFAAGHSDIDTPSVQVYVYNHNEGGLLQSHEILLGSFPLALSWVSTGGDPLCAIGTMQKAIEIWSATNIGACEPVLTLGTNDEDESVLCLGTPLTHMNILAAGTSESSVDVWDITNSTAPVHTFKNHSGLVNSCAWHPSNQGVLISTGTDKRVNIVDIQGNADCFGVAAEGESVQWGGREHDIYVALSDGTVSHWDMRKLDRYVWDIVPVKACCNSITVPQYGGTDVIVAGYETGMAYILNGSTGKVVSQKDLNAGGIYSVSSVRANSSVVFAASCPVVWDLASDAACCNAFQWQYEGTQTYGGVSLGVPRTAEEGDPSDVDEGSSEEEQ